jgi:alkanesulfonate monooxygenase SsuD/methylene tetrahydromethanopterin reductase-like flavin-dependent oxidoreductase (luciferase family)
VQVGMIQAVKTLAHRFEPLDVVYKDFMEEAVMAEALGFDFVWESEHHFEDDAWSPSQLPILAYIAARTSRIRLGTNVFLLPLHHPLRVSEDAATVDILSNGRLDLVFGSGSVADEFWTMGIDPAERFGREWEAIEIIKRSYEEDRFDFEGKYFKFPNIHQTTKPVQKPFPLWVTTLGPKNSYKAGRMGLHAQTFDGQFTPEYVRGCQEAGRNLADCNSQMFITGHLSKSRDQAWDEVEEGLWHWQNEYTKRTMVTMPGTTETAAFPPLPPMKEMRNVVNPMMPSCVGTPDQVLRILEGMLKKSNVTHFGFSFRGSGGGMPGDVSRRSIEMFAKEVLPFIRTWGREPHSSVAI